MSQLIPIWNSQVLTGAETPSPFNIPNDSTAQSIKINNQSHYWLILSLSTIGQDVDIIEPFSYLIIPYQADLGLRVDTSSDAAPSLSPEREFVNCSTMAGAVAYEKGSTQFVGTSSVSVNGDINIGNSVLDVSISGTPTFNVAPGQSIAIENSVLDVSIQGTPTFNLAAGATVDVSGSTITASISGTPSFNVANSSLDVAITGTPTFNLAAGNSVTIENSSLNVAIQGTPTFNLSSGNTVNVANFTDAHGATVPLTVGGDVNALITNSKIDVSGSTITASISGTPTFNLAAGNSVSISNSNLNVTATIAANQSITVANSTLDVAITGTPSFTVANSSLNVAIQGTPTFNLAAGTSVTVANSSLNVAIQGTPTFNLAAGTSVTVANSSLNVAIQGTPTMNIGAGNTIMVGNNVNAQGATVPLTVGGNVNASITNSKIDVSGSTITASISGTPTFNIAAGNTVNVGNTVTVSGTITANIAANQSITVSNSNLNVTATISGTPSFTVANSSLNVAITGTPSFNIAAGNSITVANSNLNVTATIAANQSITVANSSLNVAIQGTPTFNIASGSSVSISNSSLNVAIQGTPTFNIGTGNTVNIGNKVDVTGSTITAAISGTPTFNLAAGNSVNINGVAETVINNTQLPTTQIYTGQKTVTVTAGATSYTEYIDFLAANAVDQIQSGNIYIKSANGHNYTLASLQTNMKYSDGNTFYPSSTFDVTSGVINGVTTASFNAMNAFLCNELQLGLTVPSFTTNDTITIYWQLNANSTSIEVPQGQGVPVRPTHNHLTDASGTITTANTSQQVLTDIPEGDGYREYVLLQNLDTANNLYVNFGTAATTGAGSICLPPGASITFESSFCPGNAMNVLATVAGLAFTCKKCEVIWAQG